MTRDAPFMILTLYIRDMEYIVIGCYYYEREIANCSQLECSQE